MQGVITTSLQDFEDRDSGQVYADHSLVKHHFGLFSHAFAQRITDEWLAAETQSG